MSSQEALLITVCVLASVVAGAGGAAWVARRILADLRDRRLALRDRGGGCTFVVDRAELVDATETARDYLSSLGGDGWSYRHLSRHLRRTFPGYARAMLALPRTGRVTLTSGDFSQVLHLVRDGARTRLSLDASETDIVTLDRGLHASLARELDSLRAMGDGMVYPAWRQSPAGEILWANRAYLDLVASRTGGDIAMWPPPRLFALDEVGTGPLLRRTLTDPDGTEHPFDCAITRLGDDLFVTAAPAEAQVRAERALTDYVQTFSRTFADLAVGIAVFGRNRELAMFNPALTDLTGLPIDLLLGRPTLDSFLDALRARNAMPEPRNYANWRDHVADVERAAADGTYSELWHLPGACTYRVTGRPQPNGAFALLIEDISAEITLARKFRTEIETGHAVLDALPDAIAVFNPMGHLVLSNRAHDALWQVETREGGDILDARAAMEAWAAGSAPSPIWAEARTLLSHRVPSEGWAATIQLRDGRPMVMRLSRMPGGMVLVRFGAADGGLDGRALPPPRPRGDADALDARRQA